MAITIDGTGSITGVSANGGLSAAQTGSVIQVVNATYGTQVSSTSATFADTGLTATITPKFATSKILVIVNQNGLGKDANNGYVGVNLLKGASIILNIEVSACYTANADQNRVGGSGCNYLDSPATTSATTYKTQFANINATGICYVQVGNSFSTITLMEIAG
jgi:hypothetical protein